MPDDNSAVLRVAVTTALGALPLEGASVAVSTAAGRRRRRRTLLYAVSTDADGLTPPLPLDAPPRADSLSPAGGPPYALYTVEVTHPGYTPRTALHVAMFAGVPAMLPVVLTPLEENQPAAPTDLDRGGRSAGALPHRRGGLSRARIPRHHPGDHHRASGRAERGGAERHRALCRLYQERGLVRDLSHLARAGHPRQHLRAVSYVLNRVFTEWYRAQGYDFDITNSTRYDQYFVPGRDIFENISEIVGRYVQRLPDPRRRGRAAVRAVLQRHDLDLPRRPEPVGHRAAGRAGHERRGDRALFLRSGRQLCARRADRAQSGRLVAGRHAAAGRHLRGGARHPDPPQPHLDQLPRHPQDLPSGRHLRRGHRARGARLPAAVQPDRGRHRRPRDLVPHRVRVQQCQTPVPSWTARA